MMPAHMLEALQSKLVPGGGYRAVRTKNGIKQVHMALDITTTKDCRIMLEEAHDMGLFFHAYRTYDMGWNYAPKIELVMINKGGVMLINEYLHSRIYLHPDGNLFLKPVDEGEIARQRGYWTGFHVHVSTSVSGSSKININPSTIIKDGDDLTDLASNRKPSIAPRKLLRRMDEIIQRMYGR